MQKDSKSKPEGAEGAEVGNASEAARLSRLTELIIGAAIEVHRQTGPGLMESVYEECLCFELNQLGIAFRRQVELPVRYKGTKLDCGFRMDLVVENSVVVELKAIEGLLPIHSAQLLTYLKLSGIRVGLLLNFNEPVLKRGIKRLVNHYTDVSATSAPSALEFRGDGEITRANELSLSQRLCVSAVK